MASRPRTVDSSEVIGIPQGLRVKTRATPKPSGDAAAREREYSNRDASQGNNQQYPTEPPVQSAPVQYEQPRPKTGNREHREHREQRDPREHREHRERRESREPREHREAREVPHSSSQGYSGGHSKSSHGSKAQSNSLSGVAEGVGKMGLNKKEPEHTTLQAPFPSLASGLTAEDVKECAFELLVGLVGSRGPVMPKATKSTSFGGGGSKAKGVISEETKALLTFKARDVPEGTTEDQDFYPLDIIRRQLDISETSCQRIKRALSKAATAQPNKRTEAIVIPMELLLELGPGDFPSQREYQRWRKRQLLALEEGLLHHPARTWKATGDRDQGRTDKDREKTAAAAQKLKGVLADVKDGRVDLQGAAGRKTFRDAVVALAERPLAGGGSKTADMHWADGTPFSVRLYACLLGAGFSGPKESTVVQELEDVLETVGKVWRALGICPLVHRAVLSWLFFKQYMASGEQAWGLLTAADLQMKALVDDYEEELKGDSEMNQESHVQMLLTFFPHLVEAGHLKLAAFHETFPDGNDGTRG